MKTNDITDVIEALFIKDNVRVRFCIWGGYASIEKRDGEYFKITGGGTSQELTVDTLLCELHMYVGEWIIEDLEPEKNHISGNGIAFDYWETEDHHCIKFTEYPNELRIKSYEFGEIYGIKVMCCYSPYFDKSLSNDWTLYLPYNKSRDNKVIEIPKDYGMDFNKFCQSLFNLLTDKLKGKCSLRLKVDNIEKQLREVKEQL